MDEDDEERIPLENLRSWVENQLRNNAKQLSVNQYRDLVAQLIQIEQAETLGCVLIALDDITVALKEQSAHLSHIVMALDRASKRLEDNP